MPVDILMPVTSFAPEFLELYKQAAQEQVRIPLTSNAEAQRLRSRLHSLRVAMREENHPYTTIANGVQFSIDGTTLIARPADDKFVVALRNAGVTVDIEDTPLRGGDEAVPPDDTTTKALKDFYGSSEK